MTKIRIFGPFHSGTNLIHNIINEVGCTVDGVIITAVQTDKHDLAPDFLDDELVIIMYKNLYNWIYSINKEPYDIVFNDLTTEISFRGETYQNIIHLYNSYYLSYMDLLTSNTPLHILNAEPEGSASLNVLWQPVTLPLINPPLLYSASRLCRDGDIQIGGLNVQRCKKNIIFLDYGKVIDDGGFDYISSQFDKIGIDFFMNRIDKFTEVLGKPAKTHGFSRTNSSDAHLNYLPIQQVFKEFIQEKTLIGHFVDPDITDFFE